MINLFANQNTRNNEIKSRIQKKKKELENLTDAADELILLDDSESVPVQIGEVFVHMSQDGVNEYIDKQKEVLEGEIEKLDARASGMVSSLKELKTKLYAKFGKNINLEEEEE